MAMIKDINNEYQQWTQKLELFRQESALLKYRLSEMVDGDEENVFLQKAEYFQNELLLKDDMLNKLIKEVQEYKDLIENKLYLSKKINALHYKLQDDTFEFEKQFMILSKEFNEQMLQNS